jgi:hypothetical protein
VVGIKRTAEDHVGRAFVIGIDPKSLDRPASGPSSVEWRTWFFEVMADGRPEKVAVSRGVGGLREWPQAHVGLASADDALDSLNPHLTFTRHALPGIVGRDADQLRIGAQHGDGRRLDFIKLRAFPGGDGRGRYRRRLS